jgi:LPS O-antigen subunit length determinant protein (WzzB/FepE family)
VILLVLLFVISAVGYFFLKKKTAKTNTVAKQSNSGLFVVCKDGLTAIYGLLGS